MPAPALVLHDDSFSGNPATLILEVPPRACSVAAVVACWDRIRTTQPTLLLADDQLRQLRDWADQVLAGRTLTD